MSSAKENHHDHHNKHHIVLVHGACHGAWSWYKVKPRLEAAGHHVTALDLAASGINMKAIQDVHSMKDYSQPLLELMETLGPNDQKVVLVGHSLGGLNLALAMDMFPKKIAAAVFLTAFMPDIVHRPSYVLDKYFERTPSDSWLDTQFGSYQTPNGPLTSICFGPKCLSSKAYQLSPTEDLELANTLARPGSLFVEDLSKANKFSKDRFGSVPRVYVVCNEDKLVPVEFQRWMIDNGDVSDAVEIHGADHMPMFSKTQELCDSLVKIAHKYAYNLFFGLFVLVTKWVEKSNI